MPKLHKPLREAQICDELRAIYGGMMQIEDIRVEIGANSRTTATKFADGLRRVRVNGLYRYHVGDIAHRIYENEETPC